MMCRCAVRNCNNNNKTKPCTISFFSFPSDPKLLKQWRSFCGRGKELNPRTSQICMEHFKPEDFENELQFKLGFTKRRILKSGVVPSVRKLSTEEKERDKRRQKRENKKIVEMLIKEHDEKSVALKDVINKPSEQARKTEIVMKPELNPVSDLPSQPQKVFSLNNNYDMDSYKIEIERLRKENYILNENSKKQAAEIKALMKKNEKEHENYEHNLKSLETKLTKTNYELKNLEEKLLGIFTKRQIEKLKVGDKRIVWSEEDLSQGLVLYETSPKLYKLLYSKHFPLPSVRTVQVWRKKCQDIEKEINHFIENDVEDHLENEIKENLEKQIELDLEQQIKMEIEIDEIN
ncbi:THAP domain-containing protein 3-like isoform X2 [Lucilia sericata]|uniref:THAP domain-containing protein 3-like isoform X2 n=1 Tax=Lucilia sericata TaxID=13632 RepID=UPI0018A84393|nr:THAP domain-containing protein 3-like isoform X2 [Lucilia sericata]